MSEIHLKFADATVDNFNLVLSNNKIEKKFDFEGISKIYDKLLLEIKVVTNKKSPDYEKGKKNFSKFLNYNYKLVKSNLELDEEILELFKDGPNRNWYLLHLSIISYLSYLKQQLQTKEQVPEQVQVDTKEVVDTKEQANEDTTEQAPAHTHTDINYKGMIEKLMIEIEEYSESEVEQIPELSTDTMMDELNKQIPQSENAPTLIKGLIGDIKNILSNNNDLESKNIMDISKDLSMKYQGMIEKGDVNISDLLSGVLGLINDPESFNGEFDDIDASKLPDPNSIFSDMANDPQLKEVMNMMGSKEDMLGSMMGNKDGMPDMGMFGSMMANMMGNNNSQTNNKSIGDLEKEIEQMMREVQEVEEANKTETEANKIE
jgi:phage host-nuclease inhibitor protein Gam